MRQGREDSDAGVAVARRSRRRVGDAHNPTSTRLVEIPLRTQLGGEEGSDAPSMRLVGDELASRQLDGDSRLVDALAIILQ
jgi:hypothetical protein